jgi:hypothetical protein
MSSCSSLCMMRESNSRTSSQMSACSLQTNHLPVGDQPAIAKDLLDFPQDLAQVFEGARLVGIRPEQGTERFTPVRAALDGKIGQQRQRLAALKLIDLFSR